MEASALSTAKQNIRQLAKQKAELTAATPDRKKVRLLQRKIRLLKRTSRVLATREEGCGGKGCRRSRRQRDRRKGRSRESRSRR